MVVHVAQVHKEQVSKVPNAKPGKDSIELDIYGMEGVPGKDGEPAAKKQKLATGQAAVTSPPIPTMPVAPVYPPMPWGAMPPWGMMPGMPMPYPGMYPPPPGVMPYPPPPNFPLNGQPPLPPQPAFPAYQGQETITEAATTVAPPKIQYIYSDESVSMEEKRAQLDRYAFSPAKIQAQVDSLDRSIESRLANMRNSFK
eukprot:CAMPEP_0174275918 /NCGR_PEP_ID=MMETSP0439-20130205/60101_1 /TAXON_ID=0 /ORGANISM="Stereomyxa ramosa, Strain Chinc5" /LENGTH=197 /DNA_ID=CAMNT_0015368091 /DNA_START=176 /DNA_END=769 /DNA_ORIENTATION=-